MKTKIFIMAACVISFSGCMTTTQGIESTSGIINNKCSYDNLNSNEFVYTGDPKYFSIYFESDRGYLGKSNIGEQLQGKKFKFSGINKPNDKIFNKYTKIMNINGIDYQFDSNVKTAVMFEDCISALWFKGHVNYNEIKELKSFKKINGSSFSENDLAFTYGINNVKRAKHEALIDIDDFANTATIKTKYQDGILLRAWSNNKLTQKPKDFQLYVDLKFSGDWGHVKTARTKDGTIYNLTKIDTNADCSGTFGCILTETVGVTLPISLLKTNQNGFDVKFYGTKNKVITVSSYHIKSLNNGISKLNL
ncbi:hypothetical protein [Photobacterium kagoshimensis]|uniref:hypothetical protein n=1 Tax=Photobacterium kagoshimensis TaxID=2910242 RepID=UPI003D0D689B